MLKFHVNFWSISLILKLRVIDPLVFTRVPLAALRLICLKLSGEYIVGKMERLDLVSIKNSVTVSFDEWGKQDCFRDSM